MEFASEAGVTQPFDVSSAKVKHISRLRGIHIRIVGLDTVVARAHLIRPVKPKICACESDGHLTSGGELASGGGHGCNHWKSVAKGS